MEKLFLPEKVMSFSRSVNTDSLLIKKTLQASVKDKECAVLKDGYILLDFGKEIRGGIRIITLRANSSKLRIRLGESISECCAETGEKNARNDYGPTDMDVVFYNYRDVRLFDTGFRFVRIDVEENGFVEVKNIYAVCENYTGTPRYVYQGTDKKICEIFNVARRTVDYCVSKKYVWDGVKRDRLVWIGDLYPEMLALTTLYGRSFQIENSLEFERNNTPLPAWINNIQTYSFWWVITLCDYCFRTENRKFALKNAAYLNDLLLIFDSHVDNDGEMDYGGYFIDWQTTKGPEEDCGGRALNIAACKKAAELLNWLGMSDAVPSGTLIKLMKVEMPDCEKKQIIGLKYWATGKISDREKRNLLKGGAAGMSTFMSWVILLAVAENCGGWEAEKMMKEYYGGMLDRGATTFWEDFDVKWLEDSAPLTEFAANGKKDIHGDYGAYCYKGFRHSLCHGWSAGVIEFIRKYL